MHRVSRLMFPLAAAVFTLAAPAAAATLTIDDIFDPADVPFRKQSQSLCVGDTTTDAVLSAGTGGCATLQYSYTLSTDALVAATLDLYFRDDVDPGNNPEAVRITLDGTVAGQYSVALSPFHFDVLAIISPDGLLDVRLDRGAQGSGQADFFFDKSVLHAMWDDGDPDQDVSPGVDEDTTTQTAAVPEPASLLLIGSGLATALRKRAVRRQPTT